MNNEQLYKETEEEKIKRYEAIRNEIRKIQRTPLSEYTTYELKAEIERRKE